MVLKRRGTSVLSKKKGRSSMLAKVTVRLIYSFGVSTEEWVAFSSVQRSNSFLA